MCSESPTRKPGSPLWRLRCYSCLSASTGLIRITRRAGTYEANRETLTSSTTTTRNVGTSWGW